MQPVVRSWHRKDNRSSWRIGRLAGVKLTLSNNRRISAVDPDRSSCRLRSCRRRNIAGIGETFSGPASGQLFNLPGLPPKGDPRTPNIIVTPKIGVTYSGRTKKLAEHGFSPDDTNVIVEPKLRSREGTVTSPVVTAQIAPTILAELGLDLQKLEAVQKEGTQALPGLL